MFGCLSDLRWGRSEVVEGLANSFFSECELTWMMSNIAEPGMKWKKRERRVNGAKCHYLFIRCRYSSEALFLFTRILFTVTGSTCGPINKQLETCDTHHELCWWKLNEINVKANKNNLLSAFASQVCLQAVSLCSQGYHHHLLNNLSALTGSEIFLMDVSMQFTC